VSARDRILGRIREAIAERERVERPEPFASWRPEPLGPALQQFRAMFTQAGGEVVEVEDASQAATWLADFAGSFATATVGRGVPETLAPDLSRAEADGAELGVSVARMAVAETGSLIMDARDGRRTQLLAPTHVVILRTGDVVDTLLDALALLRDDLPSAIGLHSGPSKSADIGQVMVRGVHGPGRVIALVLGGAAGATPDATSATGGVEP